MLPSLATAMPLTLLTPSTTWNALPATSAVPPPIAVANCEADQQEYGLVSARVGEISRRGAVVETPIGASASGPEGPVMLPKDEIVGVSA